MRIPDRFSFLSIMCKARIRSAFSFNFTLNHKGRRGRKNQSFLYSIYFLLYRGWSSNNNNNITTEQTCRDYNPAGVTTYKNEEEGRFPDNNLISHVSFPSHEEKKQKVKSQRNREREKKHFSPQCGHWRRYFLAKRFPLLVHIMNRDTDSKLYDFISTF